MEIETEKIISLIDKSVEEFDRKFKPFEFFLLLSLVLLFLLFCTSIGVALLHSGKEREAFTVTAGSVFLLFVVYQRYDIHRSCSYDNSTLKLCLVAGGVQGLQMAIRANSCRKINKTLLELLKKEGGM